MTRMMAAAGAVFFAVSAFAQQPSQNGTGKPSTDIMTLSGCVAPDAKNKNFTLTDQGDVYRLTGMNVKKYSGQRVEIVGRSRPKKLVVQGGLYPSPNAAGQAGALDPVQQAMAAQGGPTSQMARPEIEFRVQSVRTLGACPVQQ